MTPFVPGGNSLPLKWFRSPLSGRWLYIVDRFAVAKGPAQVTLSVRAWNPEVIAVRPNADRHPQVYSSLGSVGYQFEEELPEWVRERMAVIKIFDEGHVIERAGVRWDNLHWSYQTGSGTVHKSVLQENRWFYLDVYTP